MNEKIKNKIMGRVIAIYLVRRFGSPAFFGGLFLAGFISMWRMVSFSNVFYNMPDIRDPEASYNFFSVALQNTESVVQMSLAIILVALLGYATMLTRRITFRRGVQVRVN